MRGRAEKNLNEFIFTLNVYVVGWEVPYKNLNGAGSKLTKKEVAEKRSSNAKSLFLSVPSFTHENVKLTYA